MPTRVPIIPSFAAFALVKNFASSGSEDGESCDDADVDVDSDPLDADACGDPLDANGDIDPLIADSDPLLEGVRGGDKGGCGLLAADSGDDQESGDVQYNLLDDPGDQLNGGHGPLRFRLRRGGLFNIHKYSLPETGEDSDKYLDPSNEGELECCGDAIA
jgi:hypothetical protein